MKRVETIGIYVFDDVELLDFTGPLQVLSAARYLNDSYFPVIDLVGPKQEIRVAKSEMLVKTQMSLSRAEGYDLFVIPGGFGTRGIITNKAELKELGRLVNESTLVASVCTGSLVLAKLGVLAGITATTHFTAVDLLKKIEPNVIIDRSKRYIDNGKFIIAEGVSAGIDMSFYLLERFFGHEFSEDVRKYLEYYPDKGH